MLERLTWPGYQECSSRSLCWSALLFQHALFYLLSRVELVRTAFAIITPSSREEKESYETHGAKTSADGSLRFVIGTYQLPESALIKRVGERVLATGVYLAKGHEM